MENISACPVCKSDQFKTALDCPDFFLSGEVFPISECLNCGMMFTNPRPEPEVLGNYYKSEQYISHSNTRKGLISQVYHRVRKHNFKQKFKMINALSGGKKILDVGCATGGFLAFFKNKGWTTTGIEPDEDARNFAIQTEGLNVLDEKGLESLDQKSFDVITMWHVLEHVPKPGERISQLKSLLKDDGILVIAIPNPSCYDAQHYGKFWAGYDVPRHLLHFKQNVALDFFEKMKLSCVEIRPMKFDSYYISLLSEKYQKGTTSYLKAFFTGLRSNKWAKRNKNNFSSLIYVLRKEKGSF